MQKGNPRLAVGSSSALFFGTSVLPAALCKLREKVAAMNTPHIVAVDDDPDVRDMVGEYLSKQGCRVTQADGGAALRTLLEHTRPDLVLLDVRMPGEDGLSLARYVREHCRCAVIMLTAATDVIDRVVGLEIGADDYITKPFDLRELQARIKSVLRRVQPAPSSSAAHSRDDPMRAAASRRLRLGTCELDMEARVVFAAGGKQVALTAMEFDLLAVFAQNPNRVLSRERLLDLAHHGQWEPFDRSIDIRITRLRKKIEPNPDYPQVIKTIRGVGYMYVPGTSDR